MCIDSSPRASSNTSETRANPGSKAKRLRRDDQFWVVLLPGFDGGTEPDLLEPPVALGTGLQGCQQSSYTLMVLKLPSRKAVLEMSDLCSSGSR